MKRLGLIVFIIALGLLIGLASGCRKDETPEEKAAREMAAAEPKYDNTLPGEEGIKNAIRGYNQAVIHANMREEYGRFLRKYATDYEASRVILFVHEDRTKGLVMRSKLREVAFKNISATGKETVIYTEERWEFDYLDLKTGRPKVPSKGIKYKLRYTLVKEGERWKVGKLEETEPPVEITLIPMRPLRP